MMCKCLGKILLFIHLNMKFTSNVLPKEYLPLPVDVFVTDFLVR